MNVYCLFCETARCRDVARAAEVLFGCRAISPRRMQHNWRDGHAVDIERDFLPGYIFLFFEGEPLRDIRPFWQIDGVLRCLRSTHDRYELSGDDEKFALMLLDRGGVVGKTPVYQEGDRIRIRDGAFAGVEARILRVKPRYSRMEIELNFAHRPVRTWVEYEIIEKVETDSNGKEEAP